MKEIKLKNLNETIYEHSHKSGLKTYMWVNEKVNSCYMTLTVRYGSIHTEFKVGNKKYTVPNGLAHFLEHIKFNESETTTAHDFYYKSGGDVNAFTTFEYTSYLVFTSVNLKENLTHLIDFVYNPFFSKKTIQKEKGIIVEEANMCHDDPYTVSYYTLLQNIFQELKYKNLITGKPEEIKEISIDDIENVFHSFYHPENMFLCLTGNFNPYEMAKIVDECMDEKEFPEFIPPVIISKKEPKEVGKEYEELELNVTSSKVRVGIKIPKNKFKDYDDVSLRMALNLILGANFGSTSDFKDDLINKGLITTLYPSVEFYQDLVVIIISAETDYVDEVLNRLEERLQNLEIDEKTLLRKKKANIANVILEFDDIERVNANIQDDIIFNSEIVDDTLDRYKSLNYEIFKDIAEKIDYHNKSVLIVKPNKQNASE